MDVVSDAYFGGITNIMLVNENSLEMSEIHYLQKIEEKDRI